MKNIKKYFFVSSIFLSGCLEPQNALDSSSIGSTTPLPINHPSPNKDTVSAASTSSSAILGTRFYIRSIFEETFQSDASSKTALQPILDKYLGGLDDKGASGTASFENLSIFGGTCDIYSPAGAAAGCNNSRSNIFNPMYSTATPSREAVRIKICTEVTNSDLLINSALTKIGLTNTSNYNNFNFGLVFDQFYPGTAPTAEVLSSFQDLWNTMTTASDTGLNKWRMIYFVVCRTPEWQEL